jgi:hypothetical protein
VFPRDRVFPGLSGGQVKNLSLQKHRGMPLSAFVKSFSRYKPFTGRYGSGSDETQPVKQHSQGGALGMKLLTCPAAVHYRLLVAK